MFALVVSICIANVLYNLTKYFELSVRQFCGYSRPDCNFFFFLFVDPGFFEGLASQQKLICLTHLAYKMLKVKDFGILVRGREAVKKNTF